MLTSTAPNTSMAEVELDLLERALHEERGIAVGDRSQPGERQAGSDSDHRLLVDADVDDAVGVAHCGGGETVAADVGEDDGDALVGLEEVFHREGELLVARARIAGSLVGGLEGAPGVGFRGRFDDDDVWPSRRRPPGEGRFEGVVIVAGHTPARPALALKAPPPLPATRNWRSRCRRRQR